MQLWFASTSIEWNLEELCLLLFKVCLLSIEVNWSCDLISHVRWHKIQKSVSMTYTSMYIDSSKKKCPNESMQIFLPYLKVFPNLGVSVIVYGRFCGSLGLMEISLMIEKEREGRKADGRGGEGEVERERESWPLTKAKTPKGFTCNLSIHLPNTVSH